MTEHTHVDPIPFFLEGGAVGILLIHGFTGSPLEMRLVGDYLNAKGLTVSAPLLPGHGTTVEDMNRCSWTDWTRHCQAALERLEHQCHTVFVAGLSMGAVLSLFLASRDERIAGAVAYSPALLVRGHSIYLSPLLKHLISKVPKSDVNDLTDGEACSRLWSYRYHPTSAAHELLKLNWRVRRSLGQVQCPLLVIHSTLDRTIAANSAQYVYDHAGSRDKQLVTLHNSGHCLTVDSEWQDVADMTSSFIESHTP